MPDISKVTGNSYEDGALAGTELLELFGEIGLSGSKTLASDPKSRTDIENLLRPIWRGRRDPDPACVGFLQTIMRSDDYDASIVAIWGYDNFIESQTKWGPICELTDERDVFQFGFWTGDMADGDGWCYDMANGMIRCVPVAVAPENCDELRQGSYAVYDSFHYLVAHLRCSARKRGWIK